MKQAAHRVNERSCLSKERREIFARMIMSGRMAVHVVPDLMEAFARGDTRLRMEILELIQSLQKQGHDLSSCAQTIGKQLNTGDDEIREQITEILVDMGTAARGALLDAMGCTRHARREVRLAAVKVIGAVGHEGGSNAIKRLQTVAGQTPDKDGEMHEAIQLAMNNVRASLPTSAVETRAIERSGVSPPPRKPVGLGASNVQEILKAIQKVSSTLPEESKIAPMTRALKKVPAAARIKALFLALKSEHAAVRATAARFLCHFSRESVPYMKHLKHALAREKDPYAKGNIADAINVIELEDETHATDKTA